MNNSIHYPTVPEHRFFGQSQVAVPFVDLSVATNNQIYFPKDMIRVSWQGATLEARGINGQLLTLGALLLLIIGAIALASK